MKKLISGLLVIVVLLTMIPAAAFATATTDEGLIFDLDLTGSTAEGIQVSNSVEGNSTAYYVGAAPSTGTINGRPYLAFRQSKDDSDAIGKYIKIVDAGFKNNDEMTFEFWARPRWMNATDSADFNYRMASLATGGGSGEQNKLDIYSYGRNMRYRPGGESATTEYEMHSKLWNLNLNGKWTHFVFTRKWTPASADDATNGTWTGSVYVNGTKVAAAGTKENATTRAAGSEEGLYFILGNGHYVNNSFVGDIADVKIYNTILTDAQISAKHENGADAYVAFEIEAVSADSTIDVNAGEITVDFSEALNTASVDGITFTKADGTAIKGAYIVSASGDKATVEYGKLEEGASYKLTVPGSVESVSGKNITAAEYTFTAAKTYIVNEDFTGETTVPTIPNITYMSNSIANDTSAMSIKQTSDGDYYLAVNPTTDAKDYKVTYTPSAALDTTMDVDDMHIVEVKLGSELTAKTEGVAARNVARDFMRINGAAIASAGEFWNANALFYPYDSEGVKGSAHTMSKDSNGFAYIRMVFGTYENSDGTKYLGYEMKDLNDNYTTTFKPSSTFGSAQSVTAFPNKMSSLLFSHIYPQSEDTWTAENRYSDIKVYTRKRTKVLKASEYNADTKSVTLALNNDLASGEEAKIVVTDASNATVTAAAAYNQADRTVTLTFTDDLSGAYNISLANVTDADGFACSESKAVFTVIGAPVLETYYYDEQGNDLTTLNGATGVSVTGILSNWSGEAPVAILAAYNNKVLAGAAVLEVVGTDETTVTYYGGISGLTPLNALTGEVKVFVWERFDNLVPVINTPGEFVGDSPVATNTYVNSTDKGILCSDMSLVTAQGFLNGDLHVGTKNSATLEYDFMGKGIDVITRVSPEGGKIKIMIDGEVETVVDAYNSQSQKDVIYTVGGLQEGKHRIRLEKLDGNEMAIDGFKVYVGDIKIACVGDSTTNSTTLPTTDYYPQQLDKMLGEGFEVANFGKAGTTVMSRPTSNPYIQTDEYKNSLAFLPDVVVIMLGTNDSSSARWVDKEYFVESYKSIIEEYKNLSSKPRVYINTAPTVQPASTWGRPDSVISGEMKDMIIQAANETGCKIIDINAATKNVPDLFYDGLHPNKEGCELFAKEVFKNLPVRQNADILSIEPVKGGKDAICTIISDDGYWVSSQFFNEAFKEYGFRGTIAYIVNNTATTDGQGKYGTVEQWRNLLEEGYLDIANHSKSHSGHLTRSGNSALSDAEYEELLETEINGARSALRNMFPGQKVLGYVLPYNASDADVIAKAKEEHYAVRGGGGRTNSIDPTEAELFAVKSYDCNGTVSVDTMNGWVDSAIADGRWIVEMWHGIEGDHTYNPPSKEHIKDHLDHIKSKEESLWVASYTQAIQYIRERQTSRLILLEENDSEIRFILSDSMDNTLFDYPLTVRVNVPYSWSSAEVSQNGAAEVHTVTKDGTDAYLLVEVVPNEKVVTLIKK